MVIFCGTYVKRQYGISIELVASGRQMNEQMEGVYVGVCGILLRTRVIQILRKMILPYVKNTNAAAMADLVTVNKFNAVYRESVGIIHRNGRLTV